MTTLTKLVNGVRVVLSAEEAAAFTASVAASDAKAGRAAGIELSRAEFFDRWRAAVSPGPDEARIVEWTIRQIEASALPEAAKALYAERVETATALPRLDPELGDVMTTLGAVFGLSAEAVDDLFLGAPVLIDRALCPIPGAVASLETRIAALEAGG